MKAGKKAISIVTFPKDTDAASALKAGRVDAYFGDSPVAVYYANRDHSFEVGGLADQPDSDRHRHPQGRPAEGGGTEGAVAALYANGTMKKIVTKWGMTGAVTLLK